DDKGWDARKRAYCLKIQPATGSFARNLIYSTKPNRGQENGRIQTVLAFPPLQTPVVCQYHVTLSPQKQVALASPGHQYWQ
ncbi:hypothetical protein, partial [Klebsiella pneumoniae]|uniref:hypothetical protein n=1 Tax=Klebsiella pneumoniae TaxID=573 RepID=UPI001CA54A08